MVIELNTKTRKISEILDKDELNMTIDEKSQLHIDTASMLVIAMAKDAESHYSTPEIRNLYIDILASYAKRLLDENAEAIDINSRISEISKSVEEG